MITQIWVVKTKLLGGRGGRVFCLLLWQTSWVLKPRSVAKTHPLYRSLKSNSPVKNATQFLPSLKYRLEDFRSPRNSAAESSVWVLKYCGVTAVWSTRCRRTEWSQWSRQYLRKTAVTSLTWRNHERLLDLWRLWPVNRINLRSFWVHISLQNVSRATWIQRALGSNCWPNTYMFEGEFIRFQKEW